MEYQAFDDFEYWFLYRSDSEFEVLEKESKKSIGTISFSDSFVSALDESTNIFDLDTDKIIKEFESYKSRPEFDVGQKVNVDGTSVELVKCYYQDLITGLIFCRAFRSGLNPDDHSDYVNKVNSWIESTDFYESPASTIYHEAFPHGLLYHTLSVYNNMVDLYQLPKFNNKVPIDSATLCCLTHDWCKIGLYEQYKRNVKDDKTGKWSSVDAYRRGSFPHVFGHGATSMYMAMKMFKLTEEEALGIRWHMGRWNVSENEINEYQQACEQYPLVHLVQFADQLAITEY